MVFMEIRTHFFTSLHAGRIFLVPLSSITGSVKGDFGLIPHNFFTFQFNKKGVFTDIATRKDAFTILYLEFNVQSFLSIHANKFLYHTMCPKCNKVSENRHRKKQ